MQRQVRYGRMLARLWRCLPLTPLLRLAVLSALNSRFLVGTVGVVRDERGRIVLFHHTYRPDAAWGLPGGYLRAGEDPARALVREVAEESGLLVECGPLIDIVSWPGEAHLDMIFDARLIGGTFRPSAEVSAVRCVPPHAVGMLSAKDRHLLARAFRHQPQDDA